MKNFTQGLIPLAFTLALAGALVFGDAERRDELTAERVAGQVSCVTSSFGGTIGVSVGDDGVLMIDSLFERHAGAVDAVLATLSDDRPTFLINTHTHGDHVGGNAHFQKESTVVAHENVRLRMKAEGVAGLPTMTYGEGLSLYFNGEEIRLFHVENAHTDGDTIVWFRDSNVFHMGDCYFQLGYPFIDVARGGNVKGVIAAARHVLDVAPEDARFIPGHGAVTGRKGLEEYVEMLETLTERVQEHLDQGDDVAAMVKLGITEDFDGRWAGFVSPERFVGSVVASLKAR
ncbi:MAG: MBL fold metallo-hydrolase [Planctomycetes bacterium]|nr:MBL fold metallo-hydrolase [Planctomycetota bacterium]